MQHIQLTNYITVCNLETMEQWKYMVLINLFHSHNESTDCFDSTRLQVWTKKKMAAFIGEGKKERSTV